MKLYQISEKMMQLRDYSKKGIISKEELEEIENIIKQEIQAKGDNIIKYVKSEESDIETINNEIKRLQEHKKTKEKSIENIKKYLQYHMIQHSIKKIESAIGTISLRKSSRTIINDETKLDKEYLKTEIIVKPDVAKIKDDIKNGCIVDGASIQEFQNISIK